MNIKVLFYFIDLQISFLSPTMASEFKKIELIDFRSNKAVNLSIFDETKPTYIKLWATWCDWYLKDSRPEMASKCKEVQSNITQLYDKSEAKEWHGFVNHLWTDKKTLTDFTQLYDISFPFDIDTNGVLFTYFNIRSIPTIIKIEDGKVIKRITGDEIKKLFKNK
jgi:thiol-disulfide isomerase/thioredoxin